MKFFYTLLLTSITTLSFADTTLTFNGKKEAHAMTMMISDTMMRANSLDNSDGYMIYNSENKTFTMIMNQDKTYMVFGPKEIAALGDMASLMIKQIDKQLAEMPESQRAMMRDMMMKTIQSQMPKQTAKPTYEFTGKSDKVNGYSCEIVIKKSVKDKAKFCVTEYSDIGMNSSEFAVIQSFQQTVEKLASQFGQDSSMEFSSLGDYVPVMYKQGGETGSLKSVSHEDISPMTFAIPEGYSKKEIPLEF